MGTWPVFFFVVAAEIILLRFSSTQAYMPLRESPAGFDQLLAFLPAIVKAMLLTGSAMLVTSFVSAPAEVQASLVGHRPHRVALVLNLGCVATLISIFALGRSGAAQREDASALFHGLIRATPIFWVFLLASWAGLIAPLNLWREALRRNYQAWAIVFVASVLSFHRYDAAVASQIGSLLIKPTLFLASKLYALTGSQLHCVGINADGYPMCGSREYFVEIHPACSGYKGVFLSSILLSLYFYIEPTKLTGVRLAFVILLSCLTTFLLNAVRLALLVFIGAHFSPEVAQEGFHANFGVLSLLVVTVSAIVSARAFAGAASQPPVFFTCGNGATARLLLPLTYLIGSSLFFGLFSGRFFWLYPLPALVALVGLIQIRAELRLLAYSLTGAPLFLAILTFLFWLFLVPADSEASDVVRTTLMSASFPATVAWLSARLIGAILIVPFAEELVFRGVFTDVLCDKLRPYCTTAVARFGALALAAFLFGLLHSNFLAGAIAGVIFGVARWWREELGDAIVCHSLTNLMLSFYVLLTGEWSYWP
jgi:exosortase E/protease (VPEID-CTERM system)